MATLLAKQNIPLAFADQLSPVIKSSFPDSEISKQYACKRTKTACILNGAVAPYFLEQLVSQMQEEPFAVAIDGSNDAGVKKMNPITVRIFNSSTGKVVQQFLDMCMSSSSTAEGLFAAMKEAFDKHGLPWTNCVGVSMDNTAVNMGKRNSIMTRVLKENSSVYVMGCPCHIIHNTAVKAADAFELVSFHALF